MISAENNKFKRQQEYLIEEADAGCTVSAYLYKRAKFTKKQISRMKFREDGIRVDGRTVRTDHLLCAGECLSVTLSSVSEQSGGKALWMRPSEQMPPLKVLYEDDDLLIVHKKSGVVCHPGNGHYADTLMNQAAFYAEKTESDTVRSDLHLIGRLDKDTSGIVTIAKNREAAARLWRQRETGTLKKMYLALVHGTFSDESGMIDAPIRREENALNKMTVSEDGKPAQTFYEVLEETKGGNSLLLVRIRQGRTHQIRVHMSWTGHPLFGDVIYGQDEDEKERARELTLCAFQVQLEQPFTGEKLTIKSPLPNWAEGLKNQTGK